MSGQEPPRAASRTALGAAALRVIHLRQDGEPKILNDTIAAKLLAGEPHERANSLFARGEEAAVKETRARVILRSRYAEERMAAAFQRGVRQSVTLGAGLDTFAYRQPAWAAGMRLFEVDHPASQADKRARLARAGIAEPANLEFVSIDFERVSLADGLRASSLDFSQPTFFSCLGVLVYLTPEAADAVFQLAAGFPAGSEIVFTFSTAQSINQGFAAEAAAVGEPRRSLFEPAALEQRLRELGFAEISFMSSEEAERIYFAGRSDGLRAPRATGICRAVVG